METYRVYGLIDPITSDIRYIGITTQKLNTRLLAHLVVARKFKEKNHRTCWLRFLLKQNLKPIIKLIETTTTLDELKLQEKYWISYYKKIYDLTNTTEGGDGITGYKPSDKQRLKHAKSVCQYDKEGNLINTFPSIADAARFFGKEKSNSKISQICNGKYGRNTFMGFIWRYENDDFNKYDWKPDMSYSKSLENSLRVRKLQTGKNNSWAKQMEQYSLDWVFIKEFDTMKDVSNELGIKNCQNLLRRMENNKPYHGFNWKIKN